MIWNNFETQSYSEIRLLARSRQSRLRHVLGNIPSDSAPAPRNQIVVASEQSGENARRHGNHLGVRGHLRSRARDVLAIVNTYRPLLAPIFSRPLVLIATAFLLVLIIVRPWGDYPLNDDWQYARVVRHLAETWHFKVDVGIAPALVVQAYLAAFLVYIFGFSHLLLRLLTVVLAVILVWVVDRILATVRARPRVRVLACALLIFNPIFLHLACTFMTEIYGYLLVLLAVWLWLARQRRAWHFSGRPIMSYGTGVAVALLIGASFWVRQFCVTAYPAIIVSGFLVQVRRRDWTSLLRSLPSLLVSNAVFISIVGAYFVWARRTGNYRSEFSNQLGLLHRIDHQLWKLSGFELAVYMTAFFYPFLLVTQWRKARGHWLAVVACATVALVWSGKELQSNFAGFHHHVAFPYSANIISNLGVGPFTLSPSYQWGMGCPHWPAGIWTAIEWVLIGGTLGWSFWWAMPKATDVHSRALRFFAIAFGLSTAAITIQAYQDEVLDRYFFPGVLAIVLLLGSAGQTVAFSRRRGWRRPFLVALAVLPLAWFTLAGLHDYFRWNDARWSLAHQALKVVGPDNLDGGFEVNGWLNYNNVRNGRIPRHCIGPCSCQYTFFSCSDDSYQISFEVPSNRVIVAEQSPSFWLFPPGKIYLTKRRK